MEGQAVWKPTKHRPELAGDLLLATNSNGNYFVQLTKTPFPVATAQVKGDIWQIEFGANQHSWRGKGKPLTRFAWFELRTALAGERLDKHWQFHRESNNRWRLENSRTGEVLEGELFP